MADVLDQSEVDALLEAVASGDVVEGEQRPQIFSRFRRNLESVEIRGYDFKRPERISKDQMRALHTLHETFARSFGASLSGFLRTIVEVKVAHAEQMTYSEFISGLPNPTSFNLINCAPLEGRICLELSPLIIYPIIDRLLGGTNRDLFVPQRPMTLIETRLIQRILQRGMTALAEAWANLRQINFTLGEMESNPQLVQIVPPNEVVVVIGFELKLVNRAGTMSLCIPFNTVEPIMDDLSAQSWFASDRGRAEPALEASIERNLGRADLELEAILAETTMTVAELRDLEVGDLIVTERPASSPVIVNVEGRPKFRAHLGQFKGQRAIRIASATSRSAESSGGA